MLGKSLTRQCREGTFVPEKDQSLRSSREFHDKITERLELLQRKYKKPFSYEALEKECMDLQPSTRQKIFKWLQEKWKGSDVKTKAKTADKKNKDVQTESSLKRMTKVLMYGAMLSIAPTSASPLLTPKVYVNSLNQPNVTNYIDTTVQNVDLANKFLTANIPTLTPEDHNLLTKTVFELNNDIEINGDVIQEPMKITPIFKNSYSSEDEKHFSVNTFMMAREATPQDEIQITVEPGVAFKKVDSYSVFPLNNVLVKEDDKTYVMKNLRKPMTTADYYREYIKYFVELQSLKLDFEQVKGPYIVDLLDAVYSQTKTAHPNVASLAYELRLRVQQFSLTYKGSNKKLFTWSYSKHSEYTKNEISDKICAKGTTAGFWWFTGLQLHMCQSQNSIQTILHEVTHGITHHEINEYGQSREKVQDIFDYVKSYLVKQSNLVAEYASDLSFSRNVRTHKDREITETTYALEHWFYDILNTMASFRLFESMKQEYLINKLQNIIYGMTNMDELLAEAMSNPWFQKVLASIPYELENTRTCTVFDKFCLTVLDQLGLDPSHTSVLTATILMTDEIFEETVSLYKEGYFESYTQFKVFGYVKPNTELSDNYYVLSFKKDDRFTEPVTIPAGTFFKSSSDKNKITIYTEY
jgi:hypothetical protein